MAWRADCACGGQSFEATLPFSKEAATQYGLWMASHKGQNCSRTTPAEAALVRSTIEDLDDMVNRSGKSRSVNIYQQGSNTWKCGCGYQLHQNLPHGWICMGCACSVGNEKLRLPHEAALDQALADRLERYLHHGT